MNYCIIIIYLIRKVLDRFGLVLAHPDWEVSGSSPGHTKDLKMIFTAPQQPVLVIMSLSKGNVITIKKGLLITYTMDLQTKVV